MVREAGGGRRVVTTLATGSRAFRHRNYRRFYAGQTVSLVGTWMQQVAQAWLVLELTGDPFVLGIASAAAFAPVLVLGLLGGVVADALPKRRTLLATQSVQMLLALALFVLTATGAVAVWHVVVLALLLGVTNAIELPVRQSFTVEMTGREDVGNAVGLNSALFNATRIAGPALAGLVVGTLGPPAAFLLNGCSFLASIAAYASMREEELHPAPRAARPAGIGELRATIGAGLGYVRRTDLVLLVVAVVGLVGTIGMNFGIVVPTYAREVLDADAVGFGLLMAATGLGSLAAALLVAASGRPRPALVPRGALVLGVALLLASAVRAYAPALALLWCAGFGAVLMAATANTTIQVGVPDELRGRVMSVYTTVFVGAAPAGSLITGALAASIGIVTTVAWSGAACVAIALVATARLRRISPDRAGR